MTKGIDVSSWQGDIDFKKVKNSGIEFAILRDGFSTTYDSCFLKNADGFISAGVKVPGIYHFAYPLNDNDAKKEAQFAVNAAKKAKLPKSTIIFYDFEYDSEDYCKRNGFTVSRAQVNRWTEIFCETVKSLGYVPGVYLNYDYYTRFYDHGLIEKYKIWYAYWGIQEPNIKCDFHQYSDKGSVNGIVGNVDMNHGMDPIKTESSAKKTVDELAQEVLDGKWGNGDERKKRLTEAGYSYTDVQNAVNKKLYS